MVLPEPAINRNRLPLLNFFDRLHPGNPSILTPGPLLQRRDLRENRLLLQHFRLLHRNPGFCDNLALPRDGPILPLPNAPKQARRD